jgi:hypothetical protein
LLQEIVRNDPATGSRNSNNVDQMIPPLSNQKICMDSPSCEQVATEEEREEMHSLLVHPDSLCPDSILSSSDTNKEIVKVMDELHDFV